MGYTTDFTGTFKLNKNLDAETHDLLKGLATTRRMARNIQGYGVEGEFYTLDREDFGQNRTPDVIDGNRPPRTQPGLWCQWTPTDDGLEIEWDGGEKFYCYVEWITYLVDRVLAPRGYKLNGTVAWSGEESGDLGAIQIVNNVVRVHKGEVLYNRVGERQN
jgi:hypothetical protein